LKEKTRPTAPPRYRRSSGPWPAAIGVRSSRNSCHVTLIGAATRRRQAARRFDTLPPRPYKRRIMKLADRTTSIASRAWRRDDAAAPGAPRRV